MVVARQGGVAGQEDQSEPSGRNDAPLGKVVTAIEAVEQEARQRTSNVQSWVEVAPSIELFNECSYPQQVELPLNTIASEILHRSDRFAQSSCNNAAWGRREIAEIEVFDQGRRQGTSNVQSRVEVTPSMKFSPKKGGQKVICEAEIARRTSAEKRRVSGRRDRSLHDSRKTVLFLYKNVGNEIKFLEQRSQGKSNWQSRFRVPSMDFSSRRRRSDLEAAMLSRVRLKKQPTKWKVTPL